MKKSHVEFRTCTTTTSNKQSSQIMLSSAVKSWIIPTRSAHLSLLPLSNSFGSQGWADGRFGQIGQTCEPGKLATKRANRRGDDSTIVASSQMQRHPFDGSRLVVCVGPRSTAGLSALSNYSAAGRDSRNQGSGLSKVERRIHLTEGGQQGQSYATLGRWRCLHASKARRFAWSFLVR